MVSSSTKRAAIRAEMELWFKQRHSIWRRGSFLDADSVVYPYDVLLENFRGEASDFDITLAANRLSRTGDWVPNMLGPEASTSKRSAYSPIANGVYLDRAEVILRDGPDELVFGDDEELAARERVVTAAGDLLKALNEYAAKAPMIGHNGPPENIDVRMLTASSVQRVREAATNTSAHLRSGRIDPLVVVVEARAVRDAAGSLRPGPDLLRRAGERFSDAYAGKLGELAAYGTMAALATLHPAIQHFIHMVVLWLHAMMPSLAER